MLWVSERVHRRAGKRRRTRPSLTKAPRPAPWRTVRLGPYLILVARSARSDKRIVVVDESSHSRLNVDDSPRTFGPKDSSECPLTKKHLVPPRATLHGGGGTRLARPPNSPPYVQARSFPARMPALELWRPQYVMLSKLAARPPPLSDQSGGAILGGMVVGGRGRCPPTPVDPFVGTWRVARSSIPEYAPLNLVQPAAWSGGRSRSLRPACRSGPRPSACRSRMSARRPSSRPCRARASGCSRLSHPPGGPDDAARELRRAHGDLPRQFRHRAAPGQPERADRRARHGVLRVERTAAGPAVGGGGPTQGAAPGAVGPSFNCTQARLPEEQLICGDVGLRAAQPPRRDLASWSRRPRQR